MSLLRPGVIKKTIPKPKLKLTLYTVQLSRYFANLFAHVYSFNVYREIMQAEVCTFFCVCQMLDLTRFPNPACSKDFRGWGWGGGRAD